MAKKFTTNIFFQKIGQLVDALFHLQTTAEITSNLDTEGQFAYDTDEKRVKYHDGTAVRTLLQNNDPIPDAATQIEVDAGLITDEYVSPATLNGWATSGPGGQTAFFTWKYSTNPASADPGNGFFRGNNISAGSVTELYIDDITSGNQVDISNLFTKVKGQWLLHIQQRNDASKWMQFTTKVPYTDNTGWWTLPVTFQQAGGGGSLTNLTDCLFTFVNQNDTPSSQGNTGALTYAGITIASTTTVNIGALTGWIVDNETNPGLPTSQYVNYPGNTGVTVTTIGSGTVTYVLIKMVAGVPTYHFQNTYPTSAERKTMIYASKLSHPASTVLTIKADEVDFITSPLQQFRDVFQAFNYINIGLTATPNAALNFNTTAGTLLGDGINFVVDNTNPNHKSVAAQLPCSFLPLNQSGPASPFTTTFDPTTYDVAGVTTTIPGGAGRATIQYLYYSPGIGYGIQRGQAWYPNISDAIQAVNKEVYIVRPNLVTNAIKIGVWVTTKGCTDLSNTATARFIAADMFGQLLGAGAGITLSNFQSVYGNSTPNPELVTDATGGAVTYRCGSGSDTDSVFGVQNTAGTTTWSVDGNGKVTSQNIVLTPIQTNISASAIDWNNSHQYKTLAANTTFTFSNAADAKTIIIAITNTASNYTVTWPTVDWGSGGAPVQRIGAVTDIYTFTQINGVIYGSVRQ